MVHSKGTIDLVGTRLMIDLARTSWNVVPPELRGVERADDGPGQRQLEPLSQAQRAVQGRRWQDRQSLLVVPSHVSIRTRVRTKSQDRPRPWRAPRPCRVLDRLDDLLERRRGSAPGCEKTRMPSRNAISVGIEVIWPPRRGPARPRCRPCRTRRRGASPTPPRRSARTAGTGRTRTPRSRPARCLVGLLFKVLGRQRDRCHCLLRSFVGSHRVTKNWRPGHSVG